MNYDQALDYLQKLNKFGIRLGLERITALLSCLGNPQNHLKIIHIGGTNGKGSTAAILSSLLQAGGYRVGLFSSPHLTNYTERYRLNGQEIAPEDLAGLLSMLQPVLQEMVASGVEHPTEFEVSTALAFLYFYRQQVDFLILEVGLGGAIDSTNVVTPLVTVITNVEMDHLEYLGETLPAIARVKAGIIKPGIPVVTAVDQPEVLAVLQEVARQNQACILQAGEHFSWTITEISAHGEWFDWHSRNKIYKNLHLPLLGRHQVANAGLALAVLELLHDAGLLSLDEYQLRKGLAKSYWPARLELVQTQPAVIIDGAHNLAGAKALRQAIEEIFHKQVILVIGMLADKERLQVVAELAPIAKAAVVTKPNNPRSGDWKQLADELAKQLQVVLVREEISEAVEAGLAIANKDDLVCITGSLYLVGEARSKWQKIREEIKN